MEKNINSGKKSFIHWPILIKLLNFVLARFYTIDLFLFNSFLSVYVFVTP